MINDIAAKFIVTGCVRVYSWLEPDKERKERILSKDIMCHLCKAQTNIAEWSPMTVASLLYFHLAGIDSGLAPTIAVIGNVGYFWRRILTGYPNISTAGIATVRYAGMFMIAAQLYAEAFGKKPARK